jgi:hypothetical protein
LTSPQHTCLKLHDHHVFAYFLLRSWIVCWIVWITGTRCTTLKASLLIAGAGTETAPVTVAARRLPGYKYLHSALMIISYRSFSRLGFLSPTLNSLAIEDKRGTKRPRTPSAELSPSPSDAKTPPPAPFGSPPPPGSLSEISLHRPRSPVFEQGAPLGTFR